MYTYSSFLRPSPRLRLQNLDYFSSPPARLILQALLNTPTQPCHFFVV